MEKTKVACPLCRGVLVVASAEPLGKRIRCQKCGAPFTVAARDICPGQTLSLGGSTGNGQRAAPRTAVVTSQAQSPPKLGILVAEESPRQQTPAAIVPAQVATPVVPLNGQVHPHAAEVESVQQGKGIWIALAAVVGGLVLLLVGGVTFAVFALGLGSNNPDRLQAANAGHGANLIAPNDNRVGNEPEPEWPPVDQDTPGIPKPPPEPPQKDPPPAKDAQPAPAPPGPTVTVEKPRPTNNQQKQIDDAIAKGVTFLSSQQRADGAWPGGRHTWGTTAICGLTLLECGVPAKDQRITSAAAYIRGNWAVNTETYEISLTILFLDKLGDKKDKPIIQALALRLISGQDEHGGWTYDCPILTNDQATKLLTALQKNRPKALPAAINKADKKPLPIPADKEAKGAPAIPLDKVDKAPLPPAVQKDGKTAPGGPGNDKQQSPPLAGAATVPLGDFANTLGFVALQQPKGKGQQQRAKKQPGVNPKPRQRSDNSNTQFAMLGLWAARRHNVPVERALLLCEQRFRTSQLMDGAWGYIAENRDALPRGGTESMTCVGLLGIALGKGANAELTLRGAKAGEANAVRPVPLDDQIRKGLDFLHIERHIQQGPNWPPELSLYFVWSMERIGVLYDIKQIGTLDWYQWGVGILLPTQNFNGSWQTRSYAGSNAVIDTCFALLFLKRVNLAQDLTDLNLFMPLQDTKGGSKSP